MHRSKHRNRASDIDAWKQVSPADGGVASDELVLLVHSIVTVRNDQSTFLPASFGLRSASQAQLIDSERTSPSLFWPSCSGAIIAGQARCGKRREDHSRLARNNDPPQKERRGRSCCQYNPCRPHPHAVVRFQEDNLRGTRSPCAGSSLELSKWIAQVSLRAPCRKPRRSSEDSKESIRSYVEFAAIPGTVAVHFSLLVCPEHSTVSALSASSPGKG